MEGTTSFDGILFFLEKFDSTRIPDVFQSNKLVRNVFPYIPQLPSLKTRMAGYLCAHPIGDQLAGWAQ